MEAAASFAVSCGESSEVLESVEASFDAVAKFVEGWIMRSLDFAADFGRDHGHGPHGLDRSDDRGGIIAAIGHDDLRLTACQQGQRFGELGGLTGGEAEGDRLSQAVGQQMNLGAQSTSGTPQSLVFAPFLRPVAACW